MVSKSYKCGRLPRTRVLIRCGDYGCAQGAVRGPSAELVRRHRHLRQAAGGRPARRASCAVPPADLKVCELSQELAGIVRSSPELGSTVSNGGSGASSRSTFCRTRRGSSACPQKTLPPRLNSVLKGLAEGLRSSSRFLPTASSLNFPVRLIESRSRFLHWLAALYCQSLLFEAAKFLPCKSSVWARCRKSVDGERALDALAPNSSSAGPTIFRGTSSNTRRRLQDEIVREMVLGPSWAINGVLLCE